jgi:isopentenyl phosphate kinase/ribonuclease BN (tRNA processing enzyme)
MSGVPMKKTDIMLIKLGGSLITYKQDQDRINDYLKEIDLFLSNSGSLDKLQQRISELTDFEKLNKILRMISSFLQQNPKKKIILIHGAGSIGHSLVLHLMKKDSDLDTVFPIVKLAVSLQNHVILASAVQYGLKTISFPSHPLFTGIQSEKISSKAVDSPNLSILEQMIIETDAIPVFFGDVGLTPNGWKVFSGDVYPAAIIRRLNHVQLSSIIFLTDVKGKRTGIYTKDPNLSDSAFIAKIEVDNNEPKYYDEEGNILEFISGDTRGTFDVTDAMGGKLQNLIELTTNNSMCWVVGIDEFESALEGASVGTVISPKKKSSLNITFLGTGDAFGSSGLQSASILIENADRGILLDCGPHTLPALKKLNRNSNNIDIIFLTHFHGDHTAGVPFLLLDAVFQQNRKKPLLLIGPPGSEEKIKSLFVVLYENLAQEDLSFEFKFIQVIPNVPVEISGMRLNVEATKTTHTPESQGYRLRLDDIVIAYSGDTGDKHLNYNEVIKLSSLTKRLVLTHLGTEALTKIPLIKKDSNIIIPLEGQELRI